jgi:GntR family transcriptional regulator, transcriptional repressor for pyruvate dehydrogenase complex
MGYPFIQSPITLSGYSPHGKCCNEQPAFEAPKTMFRKTQRNRVFQDLVDQIQAAILDGRLQPGDKLPSQRELVDMFQTSRASIREALRVLEQKGLIEVKLGVSGGAVIKTAGTESITENLTLLMQQQHVSSDHLAEFRESIEGDVAAMAARKAAPSDIARLEDILIQAEACLNEEGRTPYDFIRMDIRLHIALAEITGNPVFVAVMKMIHETILGFYDRFTFRRRVVLEENYRDLCALVDTVKAGQSDKAKKLALSHVRQFNRHMKNASHGPEAPSPPNRTIPKI